MPPVSHTRLKRRFHALFPDIPLPQETRLFAFFKTNELHCFIDTALPLQVILIQEKETPKQYLFCVPISANLSDDFHQNCRSLMQTMNLPIVIYWNQASAAPKQYRAWRMTYGIAEAPSPSAEEGSLYWTALSLFLKLCDDEGAFHQAFIIWHKNNPPILTRLEKTEYYTNMVLQLVPQLSTPLFYGEQTLPIFNIIPSVHQIGDILIPAWLRALPPRCSLQVLRLGVLGYLLYQGIRYQNEALELTEEGYGTLHHLTLVCIIQSLTTGLKHKVPKGIVTLIVFYSCQLLATSSYQAGSLYWNLPPGTPNQLTAIMPRYILECMAGFVQTLLHLLIRCAAMILVLGPIAYVLRRAHPDEQDGFRAIGVLAIQLFMMWITPYVFEFKRWKLSQELEETTLLSIENTCEAPCAFTVKTPLWRRVWGLGFFPEQRTQLEVKDAEKISSCYFSIAPYNAPIPFMSCTSKTFNPPQTPVVSSLLA